MGGTQIQGPSRHFHPIACGIMRQHALRLSDKQMEAVDSARGDVARNLWIVRLIERELGGSLESPPAKPARSPVEIVAGFEAQPDGSRVLQTGHKGGCRCLNCERARGSVV